MVATRTPATDHQRITQARRERAAAIARQSSHFTVQPDVITPGYIVRNRNIPGRCEVVTADLESCSCYRGRTFGFCRHIALVIDQEGL